MLIFRALTWLLVSGFLLGQEYLIKTGRDSLMVDNFELIHPTLDSLVSANPKWGKYFILTGIEADSTTTLKYSIGHQTVTVDSIHFLSSGDVNDRTRRQLFKPLLGSHPSRETERTLRWLGMNYAFMDQTTNLEYGRYGHDQVAAVVNFHSLFASYMSGVVGVSRDSNGKWKGRGELEMRLENLWGTAGISELRWKRPNDKSQLILIFYEEPFTFGLPLGLGAEIRQELWNGLFVKESKTGTVSGISRIGKWTIGGKLEMITPTEQGDSTGLTSTDVRTVTVGFRGDTRNDRWLPFAGSHWDIRADMGREIRNDTAYPIYELDIRTGIYHGFMGNTIFYFGVWGKGTWTRAGVHIGQQVPFGGTTSLRGYREEQFRVKRLLIGTVEWIFSGRNRYQTLLFVDGAFQSEVSPFPIGFGLGFRQNSEKMVLSLMYGLGREDRLTRGKLHLRITTKL